MPKRPSLAHIVAVVPSDRTEWRVPFKRGQSVEPALFIGVLDHPRFQVIDRHSSTAYTIPGSIPFGRMNCDFNEAENEYDSYHPQNAPTSRVPN